MRSFVRATARPVSPTLRHRLESQQLADHPATEVSFDDAIAFCTWASVELRRTVRLPRGDEWEAAARGAEATIWPWGDVFDPERYPNLYASIAATVNFIARQPRVFAETLGKMMWWCGEDKIIYGGETPIWHPQWALEEFWNFELPRDIVEERGYPQLTEQAKRKILGENLARLHGIDVESKKAELGAP
jgi:hypothetical protein